MANDFAINITAVDHATAVFKKVNDALGKFTRPITNTQKSLAALGKESGLATLTKRLGTAAEKLGMMEGSVSALAGIGSVGGLAVLARQWGDMGLQATNAAYRIGMGTQQLAQFQSAARLGGASADAMAQGVANMAKNIGDALSNRNPAMAGFAQQLGIRFRYGPDGKADVATAYKDLKAALDKAPTAQGKNAILEAFGQPEELRRTIENLDGLKEAASDLRPNAGAAAAAGAELGLSLGRLGENAKGLGDNIEVTLGPGLKKAVDWLNSLTEAANKATRSGLWSHVATIASGVVAGAAGGAAVGAGIGAGAGLAAGGVGFIPGAIGGAGVGAIWGGVTGGVGAAALDAAGKFGPRVGKSPYSADIQGAAENYGVRPGLIAAIIAQESGGDPTKVGDGGRARGLMQMHKDAADDAGYDWNSLDDPRTAIFAGTAYLRKQLDRFGGDERLATMAYNGGPRTVQEGPGSKYYDQATRYADQTLARPEAAGGTVTVHIHNAPPGTTATASHSGAWPVRMQYGMPTGATNP